MSRKTIAEYQDIIHLPRPVFHDRAHLSLSDRAAQFSPFAALSGYDDAVKEAARQSEKRVRQNETYD